MNVLQGKTCGGKVVFWDGFKFTEQVKEAVPWDCVVNLKGHMSRMRDKCSDEKVTDTQVVNVY